LRRRAD